MTEDKSLHDHEYTDLEEALEEWFKKPFDELPEDLQKRVERRFRPTPWDNLTSDDRRRRACLWDGWENPAFEKEQKRLWDDFMVPICQLEEKIEKSEKKIAELEYKKTDSPSEFIKKEDKLQELNSKLRRTQEELSLAEEEFRQGRKMGQSRNTPLTILITRYLNQTNGKGDWRECHEFLLNDPEVDEKNGRILYTSFDEKPQNPFISSVRKTFNKYKKEWKPLNR